MVRSAVLPALLLCAACGDPAPRERPLGRARQEIIGGIEDPSHWYVVMIGDATDGFCTGTLVSRRTVITAGHCWGFGVDAIRSVWFDIGDPLRRIHVGVTTSQRHPMFDDFSLSYDLAVVKLDADAPVQAVPLLRETLDSSFIGPPFTWVGYGDTNRFQNGFGTRRVVTFPIQLIGRQSNIPLPANAPSGASDAIDNTEVYFQLLNKNTCQGDSGGPGFAVRNGVERHAAVTSYGDDNCAYDGVAERTDPVTLSWVQAAIDGFESNDPCRGDGTCNASCVTTTPTPRGTLGDPDCADQHCGGDGVCVLSCSPVDPDCSGFNLDNCPNDGYCQMGCMPADVDCSSADGGTAGTGGGTAGSGGGTAGSGGGTAGTGGGDAGTGGGTSGSGGGDSTGGGGGGAKMDTPGGCHCGSPGEAMPLLLALLALRRSRQKLQPPR